MKAFLVCVLTLTLVLCAYSSALMSAVVDSEEGNMLTPSFGQLIRLSCENTIESLHPTNHKDPLSALVNHILLEAQLQPLTDSREIPPVDSVSNAPETVPDNTPVEPVYSEASYVPSSTQYFPLTSSSTNIQQSNSSFLQNDLALPDLSQTTQDEVNGSCTTSFSSTTPPLPLYQNVANGYVVGSFETSTDVQCSQVSTSNNPASAVFLNYSTTLQCRNCGNMYDILLENNSFFCNQCFPKRPIINQQTPSVDYSKKRKRSKPITDENSKKMCSNCGTTVNRLWRRSVSSGDTVCNACGLYEKSHHVPRPKHMWKDTIQSRQRKPKSSQASKVKGSTKKSSKESASETSIPPQYVSSYAPNYTVQTYNPLQVRDFSSSIYNVQQTPMVPPVNNSQVFYNHYSLGIPPQYVSSYAPNYTVQTYNPLQVRDFSSSIYNVQQTPMVPPVNNSQVFYNHYSLGMLNVYNSVPSKENLNISQAQAKYSGVYCPSS